MLDELESSHKDPYLFAIQPGISRFFDNNIKMTMALGLYASQNLKGHTLEHSAKTNSVNSQGLEKEFTCIVFSGQIDMVDHLGMSFIRPFGEFVVNTTRSRKEKGFIVGGIVGDKEVRGAGTWQSALSYRYLDTDAWFDIFPDSDAFGGETNIRGVELIFNYGLSKASTLGIDLYRMGKIYGNSEQYTLIQIDVGTRF